MGDRRGLHTPWILTGSRPAPSPLAVTGSLTKTVTVAALARGVFGGGRRGGRGGVGGGGARAVFWRRQPSGFWREGPDLSLNDLVPDIHSYFFSRKLLDRSMR